MEFEILTDNEYQDIAKDLINKYSLTKSNIKDLFFQSGVIVHYGQKNRTKIVEILGHADWDFFTTFLDKEELSDSIRIMLVGLIAYLLYSDLGKKTGEVFSYSILRTQIGLISRRIEDILYRQ